MKNLNSKAAEMCKNVSDEFKEQAITLAKSVLIMQEKIEKQIPDYAKQPLAQQVTVGTGETMLRQNPATQEFRATVRDYAQALNNLQDILEEHKVNAKVTSLNEMRNKLKAAK